MTATTERSWHIGEYHPLAWAETAVKAVAFVVAYVAFVHALDRSLHSPSGVRIVELVLLGVAEVGILLTIVDRVLERELIAVGFVVFNNAAHASMLYALLAIPGPGGLLSIFCAFMLGGELIKWRWLHKERPPMRQLEPHGRAGVRGRVRGHLSGRARLLADRDVIDPPGRATTFRPWFRRAGRPASSTPWLRCPRRQRAGFRGQVGRRRAGLPTTR